MVWAGEGRKGRSRGPEGRYTSSMKHIGNNFWSWSWSWYHDWNIVVNIWPYQAACGLRQVLAQPQIWGGWRTVRLHSWNSHFHNHRHICVRFVILSHIPGRSNILIFTTILSNVWPGRSNVGGSIGERHSKKTLLKCLKNKDHLVVYEENPSLMKWKYKETRIRTSGRKWNLCRIVTSNPKVIGTPNSHPADKRQILMPILIATVMMKDWGLG